MSFVESLMGVGFPAAQAGQVGFTKVAKTTTGTTTGTAVTTPSNTYNVLTTAASQTGIRPTAPIIPGDMWIYTNTTATAAVIYPPTGGTMANGSVDAGVNLAQNKTMLVIARTASAMDYILSA